MADPVRVFRPHLIALQESSAGRIRLFAETQGIALDYELSINERLNWIEQLSGSIRRELARSEEARRLRGPVKED